MESSNRKTRIAEFALLLLILLLVFYLPNMITFLKVNYFHSLLDITKAAEIQMPTNIQSQVYVSDSNILIGGDDKLSYYNKFGDLIWDRDLRGKDTLIRSNAKHSLLVEQIRGEIVLLNKENEILASIKDVGSIEFVEFSSNSYTAVKLKDKNEVQIFDQDLKRTAQIPISFGDIIAIKLANDQDILMLATINLLNNQFESFVLQFDMNGRALGSSDCGSQLVYSMHMDEYQLIVTDTSIKSFNQEGQLVSELASPGIVNSASFFRNRLYANVIESNDENTEVSKLLIYSDDLSSKEELLLPDGADGLIVNDRFIAIYSEGLITFFDHSLEEVGSINTQLAIKTIQWMDNLTLVVNDNSKTLVYEIK